MFNIVEGSDTAGRAHLVMGTLWQVLYQDGHSDQAGYTQRFCNGKKDILR